MFIIKKSHHSFEQSQFITSLGLLSLELLSLELLFSYHLFYPFQTFCKFVKMKIVVLSFFFFFFFLLFFFSFFIFTSLPQSALWNIWRVVIYQPFAGLSLAADPPSPPLPGRAKAVLFWNHCSQSPHNVQGQGLLCYQVQAEPVCQLNTPAQAVLMLLPGRNEGLSALPPEHCSQSPQPGYDKQGEKYLYSLQVDHVFLGIQKLPPGRAAMAPLLAAAQAWGCRSVGFPIPNGPILPVQILLPFCFP
eukprot:TRINITY_DN6558_c0_g3_i1.p1 TRINITY_DN6558_c0_g3~~TRINITY_DN6558_c0_g3_i1.p1  ORF type:complete len:247 (+),score=-5.58 TRINITY_DN6558_c0_g3_i1:152-892(+)